MDEKIINARIAILRAQRDEAMDRVAVLAAENSILQEELASLKAEQQPKDE